MALSRDKNQLTDKVKNAAERLENEFSDVFITETGRTEEQQRENIAKGVSWTMNSYHMMNPKARAFDIAFRGPELYPSDMGRWRKVADFLKPLGMDWGYDLWGKDMPHFQCDGSEYNQNKMSKNIEFDVDYFATMENYMDSTEYTIKHNSAAKDTDIEQIKALIDIAMEKKMQKVIKYIDKHFKK